MDTLARHITFAAIGIALCAPGLNGFAADLKVTCTGLGYAQRRVLEHSFEGVDALRRYVIITRPVLQISMVDVMESLDDWRANARCTTTTTAHPSRVATAAPAEASR
jgi:hypothetical protein